MSTDLDIDDFRTMARRPQHYSNYTLAGALHQVLDYLEQAKAELVGAKIFWTNAHERAEQAERERDELHAALRQAEAERDALKADREAST